MPATVRLARYLGLCVGALVGLNVYFLASGVMALTRPQPTASPGARRPPVTSPTSAAPASAAALLRRNPFDSVTGPLDVEPIDPRTLTVPLTDPLKAPLCEDIFVSATAEFENPRLSTAIVRGPGEAQGRARRVGDRASNAVLTFIGFNPLESSPSVWFDRGGQLCQSPLFRTPVAAAPAPAPPAVKPRPPRRRSKKSGGLPPELAARIHRDSPTRVRVERAVVDQLISGYSRYMRGLRVRPVEDGGRVVGMRLTRMRSNGLLAHLGFEPNDQIVSINGYRMTGPESALGVYARLRTTNNLQVQVRRGDRPVTLEVAIQ